MKEHFNVIARLFLLF